MLYYLFMSQAACPSSARDPPMAENALVCPVTILLRLAEREKQPRRHGDPGFAARLSSPKSRALRRGEHGDKKRGDFVKFDLGVPPLPNLTKPAAFWRKTRDMDLSIFNHFD